MVRAGPAVWSDSTPGLKISALRLDSYAPVFNTCRRVLIISSAAWYLSITNPYGLLLDLMLQFSALMTGCCCSIVSLIWIIWSRPGRLLLISSSAPQ
jgi:hypothetical protein